MYWLGLDENEVVNGSNINYPTQYRLRDALQTAVSAGWTTIRAHTLGISHGNPLSFRPSCGSDGMGVFNDSALDAADFALYLANQLSVKFIVPLTDNWKYYEGGKHCFTDCFSLSEDQFFTDSRAIQSFQRYIQQRLNHVNLYTGVAAKDDPAILAWETGNELNAPANWTALIAAYIKSIDSNHLVLDGNYGINTASLSIPEVDLYSDHFYPVDVNRMLHGAATVAQAGKVYIAGEYDSTKPGPILQLLTAVNSTPAIAGSNFWSVFPHRDDYGFVQHGDGFTVHFPGDTSDMATVVQLVRNASATIRGLVPSGPYPLPLQPTIDSQKGNSITWRGAAGAASYSVDTSTAGPNGPWANVCSQCVTDNGLPYAVPGSLPSGTWLQVTPYNIDGLAGPASQPYKAD